MRRAVVAAAILLLTLCAHAPLFQAGLTGADVETVAEPIGPRGDADERFRQLLDAPITFTVRSVLERVHGERPTGADLPGLGTARLARLQNLALLVFAALLLRPFVRRLLQPWTGGDQARAAGTSALALLLVHPLSVGAVAVLEARAMLFAVLAAVGAAAAFLHGRQERSSVAIGLAALATFAAGLIGPSGYAVPAMLAAAELASARRHRPLRERLRTAATTVLAFGVLAALGGLARNYADVPGPLAPVRGVFDLGRTFEPGADELGLLVLPVNAHQLGVVGFVLAGLVFLLAVQPALVAARSAPRLWGWLLFAWFGGIALALVAAAPLRANPRELTESFALLPAVVVMSAGLALATTSLSGLRRVLLPTVLALSYAGLAHANARPYVAAARASAELREDVLAAVEGPGTVGPARVPARVLVLDPPRRVAGVAATGADLGWIAQGDRERPTGLLHSVEGLTERAFLALTRQRELAALREGAPALVVVCPLGSLGTLAAGDRGAVLPSGRRVALTVGESTPSSGPRSWRGDARSPDLDLATLTVSALRITASPGVDTDVPPRVRWRARRPELREGEELGVWVRTGASPEAVFDLGGSLAWRLGERAQRLWFEGGLPTLELAEVLDALPSLAPVGRELEYTPRVEGDDWLFDPPRAGALGDSAEQGVFALELLDLSSRQRLDLPVEREGAGLRARDAAAHVARAVRRSGGGAVAWSLEWRVDDVVLARAQGRRHGRLGSREEE